MRHSRQQVKGRLERPLGPSGSLGQSAYLAELARQQRHHALVSLKSMTRSTIAVAFSLDIASSAAS